MPAEYSTIQAAINAASDGDVVLVADGTYSERINYNGKNITVQSLNGAAYTTIQGDGADGPVVTFSSGETSAVLKGFTIDNQATSNNARGIYISNNATPTIKNSVIKGNTPPSWQNGAGIYISGGGVTIENTTIGGSSTEKNSCNRGCGLYAQSSSYDITITGSTITYNTANSEGGAIYLTGITGMTTITDTTISNNSSSRGTAIYSSNSPLTITNTSMDSNSAVYEGGALCLNGASATTTITGGTINNNSARDGAAVYILNGADLTVSGTTISSNTSSNSYGAIWIRDSGSTLNLSKATLSGNSTPARGGAIFAGSSTVVTIENSNITGNVADDYSWSEGGGIYSAGTLNIYSSTIAGNYARGNGGGLNITGSTTIKNSIIWGNTAPSSPQIDGAATVTYSDVEGGFSGTGNINADPLFVDLQQATSGNPTTAGDFHIQSGSPCIDTGTSAGTPADDIDGDSRPQDGDGLGSGTTGDGSDYDMGSDEYVP
ncbi:MAG: hypothetical protein GXO97_06600 [Nitrospirae bacterium]|nr:hypothetical protein [Nitrospirota bacterium]